MVKLEARYNIHNVEAQLQEKWARDGVYKWCGHDDFVIDTPPPTISGMLHIGHVFSYCHTDFIARYQRMLGKDVFYPMGFDDNGLPTEKLVEKKYKTRVNNTNKEEFIGLCHKTSEEHRAIFRKLFKGIGLSVDWNLEYHTISNECQALSQMSFLDLYKKGHVYQKEQPTLWDTRDQTAIAQAEIEDRVFASEMNYLRFLSVDGEEVLIATTRPELLPACVAVFVNPDDCRYKHLIGKLITTPLFIAQVPVISDSNVKIDKGSGAVMCCTFGDEMDVNWWMNYSLERKVIINKRGQIYNLDKYHPNNQFNSILEALKVKEARVKIIELLDSYGCLERKEQITHQVKCAERSGAPLEIIPTQQWFIKVIEHKEELLAKARKCNWYPKNKMMIIEQWVKNLKWDWCISRQRYFGVPFPIWYSKREGEEGKILIPEIEQLPIDPATDLPSGYDKDEVVAEFDVMDTWATSSISPQINRMYIDANSKLDSVLVVPKPLTMRPQAHEIIRTWAFYTLVKSHFHSNYIPWDNLMISGWCLSEDKSKMSKSKGNIIEPRILMEQYGADVIRYWASNARLGTDTVFSEHVMKIGKRLTTKIWNAGKFISNFVIDGFNVDLIESPIDLWIVKQLHDVIDLMAGKLDKFEYCEARSSIEDFFWHHYCDNYLELVKSRAYNADVQWHDSAIQCLSYTFNVILRLFAIFFPFITEEIYTQLYNTGDSIHSRGNWPTISRHIDDLYLSIGDATTQLLKEIRERKSVDQVSIKKPVSVKLSIQTESIKKIEFDLMSAANADQIFWELDAQDGEINYKIRLFEYQYI